MMKKKFLTAAIIVSIVFLFGAFFCTGTAAASSPDEAVISGGSGEIAPIPTEPTESSSSSGSADFLSSADYALFYTQTTLLTLLAGYLIIFKFKGTRTKEKMHRRI